ncbi:MAG TPA: glycosyltransferase, partial [bacterium]|nr:glycosyltransferase [bacterium]
YLIQAADDLPPDIKIVICTSGADTKQYADEVAKIAKTKKNIVYIDKMLDPQDYLELYSHCRVFVCPSVYEPFGIINLEAMACRRPVVASSVGGIKEVVVQDETGILIDPAEPRAIAQAVNNLLKNRELAEEMGQKGRKRVEESFSWAVIAHKTKRLYVDLVGQWWKDEKRHFLSHPDLDQY